MNLDGTNLVLSLLFGCLGMGYFMYGKNAGHFVPMGAGVALLVCPYFIANTLAMVIVCLILSTTPFVVRES
jgi:hypothetical protein